MPKRTALKQEKSKVQRVSISIPQDHYRELARIAGQKRVSVAWVVRDAVDSYLSAETPLLRPRTTL